MKNNISLGNQILFIVLLLTFSSFWICSLVILKFSHQQLLSNSFEQAVSDQRAFANFIKEYALNSGIDLNDEFTEFNINSSIKRITKFKSQENVTFRITSSNGVMICSNIFEAEKQLSSISPNADGQAKYMLTTLHGKKIILLSSVFAVDKFIYRLDYIKDINAVFNKEQKNAFTLSLVLLLLIFVLFLFLYLAIKKALKPLESLSSKAKQISEGSYDIRADVVRNDEVGILSIEFNKMLDSLQMHYDMLKENNRQKEMFASNFAHELKTPLTSIIGFSDIALRNTSDTKLQKIHAIIKSEGKRLDKLSSKLLSLSNMTDENFIDINETKIDEIIETVKFNIKPMLLEKRQNLIIKNNIEIVRVDKTLFISLLINLLTNAVKASENDKNIELIFSNDNASLIISVKDYGIGMEKEEINKIVEPFYMVDKARDRSSGGSGLGLSLCDVIVKAHQGEMIIESEINVGTKIIVKLPQALHLENI